MKFIRIIKKLAKIEYLILVVIIATLSYYFIHPEKLYKGEGLYEQKYKSIEPADLVIINPKDNNEFLTVLQSDYSVWCNFSSFDNRALSIKELSGVFVKHVGGPFSNVINYNGKSYFVSIKNQEEVLLYEVDFPSRRMTSHKVLTFNVLESLLDTTIIVNNHKFYHHVLTDDSTKIVSYKDGFRIKINVDEWNSLIRNLYLDSPGSNNYKDMTYSFNKYFKINTFSVYDIYKVLNFFRRNDYYQKKYFENFKRITLPIYYSKLHTFIDANNDGNDDLILSIDFQRFYDTFFFCYDLKNERIIWQRNDFKYIKIAETLDIDEDGLDEILISTYSPCDEPPIDFIKKKSRKHTNSYFAILNSTDGSIKEINNKPALIESPRGYYEYKFLPLTTDSKILLGMTLVSDQSKKNYILFDYKNNEVDTLMATYNNLLGFSKNNNNIMAYDNEPFCITSIKFDSKLNTKVINRINIDQKTVTLYEDSFNINGKQCFLTTNGLNLFINNKLNEILKINNKFYVQTFQTYGNKLYYIGNIDRNRFSSIEFIKNKTLNPLMVILFLIECLFLLLFLFLKQTFPLPLLPIKDNYFVLRSFFGIVYSWRLTGAYSRFFKLPRRISLQKATAYKFLYDISDKVQEFYTHSALFVKTKVYKIHTENELSIIQRISHDLKNQIMMIKLQMDEYYERIKKKQAQEVESMLETIKEISVVSQTLSGFSHINKLYKEKTGIILLIEEILSELFSHPNIDSIHLDGDGEYYIYADKKLLKTALKNLICNALDAIKSEQQIVVTTKQVDHIISIIITNPTGMTQEDFEKVEEIGYTTKKTGSGLGIPIARSIIEKHDGKFQIIHKDHYFIVEIYLPYEHEEKL